MNEIKQLVDAVEEFKLALVKSLKIDKFTMWLSKIFK